MTNQETIKHIQNNTKQHKLMIKYYQEKIKELENFINLNNDAIIKLKNME